jgi:serine phosphatase RsbU (regulator of sigma subunit)
MMKKTGICLLAGVVGIAIIAWAIPILNDAQPHGIEISRAEARAIADEAARGLDVPVDESWPVLSWIRSELLEHELAERDLREEASLDPVMAPRLRGYVVRYFRVGGEKYPLHGLVVVGRDGTVQEARRYSRSEESGASPSIDDLRPLADDFVASRSFPGVNELEFVSAHPTVYRSRVDHMFRYQTTIDFPLEGIVYYLNVHFVGDELAGWILQEEYADGRAFSGGFGGEVLGTLVRYVVLGTLLITLLVIFLRMYHAGEVGVQTAGYLFIIFIVLSIVASLMSAAEDAVGVGFGGLDAIRTALAMGAFRFLFFELPSALLLFVGWAVGESYARERWGSRLASFDALVHRNPFNAAVGRAMLAGLVLAPVVAAADLAPAALAVLAGWVSPDLGIGTLSIVGTTGGAFTWVVYSVLFALLVGVVAILFLLALFRKSRFIGLGVVLASGAGVVIGLNELPVQPEVQKVLLGLGAILVCSLIFLALDLLSAITALALGWILVGFLPYLSVAEGSAAAGPSLALALSFGVVALFGLAGVITRREVTYAYEDLAPHVRRIVERERVKAEIDAANRIQSALLPDSEPTIAGISVASHYRAATEIGGDYFDFLHMKDDKVGIAFGDVAGHGLTSGIVMAMAKSALLVQLQYDSRPRRVMEMMNDVVIRTGPSRMMMTFFFGLLDPSERTLSFSSAGHLDPYVFRARERRLEELSAWGYPLGVRRRKEFPEIEVAFEPGDRLVLYSDGLIEALDDDGEPFGFDRFEKTLLAASDGSAEEIRRALLDAVRKFTRNRPPEDDQTLVVISFDGVAAARQVAAVEERVAEPVAG